MLLVLEEGIFIGRFPIDSSLSVSGQWLTGTATMVTVRKDLVKIKAVTAHIANAWTKCGDNPNVSSLAKCKKREVRRGTLHRV